MTAASGGVNSPQIGGTAKQKVFSIVNADIVYAGAMACIDYTDEVHPAQNTQGLVTIGRFPETVDNTSDGETSQIEHGIFRFTNSSTYPVARSGIGRPCYVEDDTTVAGYASAMVPAGLVYDVDDDGVWVDMTAMGLALARELSPVKFAAKTAAYTLTAAIAFEGKTLITMTSGVAAIELTLPSAVAGMRFGLVRGSASATHDVTVQAATGDVIEASDGYCAAGKQVDNTVDAVSKAVWWEAINDTYWAAVVKPEDWASWVKNDA